MNSMLRIAIYDKDKKMQTQLLDYIAKDIDIEDDYITECFFDLEFIKKRIDEEDFKFNLIFIEVGQSEAVGFELAQCIRNQNIDIDIFFLANTIDHVEEAFRYRPVNYLIKPIEFDRFQYEMKQYLQELQSCQRDVLFVNVQGKQQVIPLHTIAYCTSNGRKIGVFFSNGSEEIWYYGKLCELEESLRKYDFIRCHQSYLISGSKITSIDSQYVCVGQEYIPISRKYAENLKVNWERLQRKRQSGAMVAEIGSFEDVLVDEEDATWIGNTLLPTKQRASKDIMKYGVVVGIRGSRQGISYRIYEGEEIAIGRDSKQCQIVIGSGPISRRHCSIKFDMGEQCFYVQDLSTNGTYITGMGRLQSKCWVKVEKDSILKLINDDYAFVLT